MNEQPCDTIEQSIELLISTFPQEQHGETDTIMRALLIATEGFTAGTVAETVRALLRYQVLDHDPHYMPTAPELAMYLRDVEAGTGFDFYSAAEHQEQAPAAPSEPVGMPLRASRPMPRAGGVVLSMRPRQSETELLAAIESLAPEDDAPGAA